MGFFEPLRAEAPELAPELAPMLAPELSIFERSVDDNPDCAVASSAATSRAFSALASFAARTLSATAEETLELLTVEWDLYIAAMAEALASFGARCRWILVAFVPGVASFEGGCL